MRRLLLAALVTWTAVPASSVHAASTTIVISGNDNPFLAGQPDGTTVSAGDVAPDQSPTLALTGFAPGTALSFSGVGGFLNQPGATVPLDGYSFFSMDTSNFGLSGPQGLGVSALVGVFLDNSVPIGAPPAARNDGTSFASISPMLGQIFFIGDGLTGAGTGSTQQFFAPVGATRLFLGSADGFGWYNNIGTATITINYTPTGTGAVPEPATWAMMILGFSLIGSAMRRAKKISTSVSFA